MNINDFKGRISHLSWWLKYVRLGNTKINFLLPYTQDKSTEDVIDMREAEILDFWWINDRVNQKQELSNRYVWWGAIHLEIDRQERYLPLILEFFERNSRRIVCTPPGRPGNPMTILIDRYGEIVPEVTFNFMDFVRIYFLSHNWEGFGWNFLFPAVALQFQEGYCHLPQWEINKWQAFLKRNQA